MPLVWLRIEEGVELLDMYLTHGSSRIYTVLFGCRDKIAQLDLYAQHALKFDRRRNRPAMRRSFASWSTERLSSIGSPFALKRKAMRTHIEFPQTIIVDL